MQTKLINFYDLFYNIFSSLSNISSFFLDNSMSIYCTIFILVPITLLGFVLFANNASTSADVRNLLDTDAYLERRANENKTPLNLAYVSNDGSSPLLIDKNDHTGLRLKSLFLNRTTPLTVRDGRTGFITNSANPVFNNQGELLVNIDLYRFTAVNQSIGVQSRGVPIQTDRHHLVPSKITVLRV